MDFGEIILGLGVLLTLASFGVASFLAFGLMAALGLITEMSFKRIFFISFGLALIVPILFGGAMIGMLSQPDVQASINETLNEALPSSEGFAEELSKLSPITEEELRGLEDGSMTETEVEQRIEERVQRFLPQADVEIDNGDIQITTPDNSVNITID